MAKVLVVLPARYASSRFPGKPLALIAGKSLIYRAYHRVLQAQHVDTVVVATDDDRIAEHVRSWGGNVVMTSPDHAVGTERVAEAARAYPEHDIVLNVQGDEPLIHPEVVDQVAQALLAGKGPIVTPAAPITHLDEFLAETTAKAILDHAGYAQYFSRLPIPHPYRLPKDNWLDSPKYKHISVYGFTAMVLQELVKLPAHPIELSESLEMLRWLAYGYRIQCPITTHTSFGVDLPEDIARTEAKLQELGLE